MNKITLAHLTKLKTPIQKHKIAELVNGLDKEKYTKFESQEVHTTGNTIVKTDSQLNFEDHNVSTAHKTNLELIQSWIVFSLCQIPMLASHSEILAKSLRKILGDSLFSLIMKMTFYGHFIGGEDERKIVPGIERMKSFGVLPILDYSAEDELTDSEVKDLEATSSQSKILSQEDEEIIHKYRYNEKFADRRKDVTNAHIYFYRGEYSCDKNMENFLKCIDAVGGTRHGQGFAAIKITAIARPQILLQLSEIIMRTRKFMTNLVKGEKDERGNVLRHHLSAEDLKKKIEKFEGYDEFMSKVTADDKGIIHLFPWSQLVNEEFELQEAFKFPDLKTGKMISLLQNLTELEAQSFRGMLHRLHHIAKEAVERNVYVTVDAEHSYFQPAISRLAVELMRIYNKTDTYVWNTYQCYLKDAYNEVFSDVEQAARQNFHFGAKVVRGAYMRMERARAKELGYEDPINPTYDSTTEMYHKVLQEILKRIKADKDSNTIGRHKVLVASHNEKSVKFIIERMKDLNILNSDKTVCFAQLTGMCDFMTLPLANSGYRVYKYLPYGPVVEVIPYLSRRVQENQALMEKVGKEKRMLRRSLFSRLKKGQIFYTPQGKLTPV